MLLGKHYSDSGGLRWIRMCQELCTGECQLQLLEGIVCLGCPGQRHWCKRNGVKEEIILLCLEEQVILR